MSKIAQAAMRVLTGEVANPHRNKPGWCLAYVQISASTAGLPITGMGARGDAATAETALAKYAVPVNDMMPGDLVFSRNADTRGRGHVGIYMGNGMIAENASLKRGKDYGGYMNLVAVSQWDPITSVVRVPGDVKSAEDKADVAPSIPEPQNNPSIVAQAAQAVADTVTGFAEDLSGAAGGKDVVDPAVLDREGLVLKFNSVYGLDGQYDLRGRMTNFGPINSLVVLRKDSQVADNEVFAPVVLTYNRTKDYIAKKLRSLYTHNLSAEKAYQPYLDMELYATKDDFPLMPIPGVTRIKVNLSQDGTNEVEVSHDIGDAGLATAIYGFLASAKSWRNAVVDLWWPTRVFEPAKNTLSLVVEPLFSGHISGLKAAPWPHKISYTVVPAGDAVGSTPLDPDFVGNLMTGGWKQVEARTILLDLEKMTGWKILGWAPGGLAGMPNLKGKVESYSPTGRTPRDILFEIATMAGYKVRHITGLELFGKSIGASAVWVVYDPGATDVTSENFWRNGLWSLAKGPMEKAFNAGAGAVNILYPAGLDPYLVSKWAHMLEVYGKDDWLKVLQVVRQDFEVRDAYRGTHGPETFIYEFVKKAFQGSGKETIDLWAKHMVEVIDVVELSTKPPTDFELANPLMGSATGHGTTKRAMTAAQAAKVFRLKRNQNGTFSVPTAAGPQEFSPNDRVYLYYEPNRASPLYAIPVAQSHAPEAGSDERGMEQTIEHYPYTLRLRVNPSAGFRPGIPTILVGYPPLDGEWETHGVEFEVSNDYQACYVTLRTAREIFTM